MGLFPLIFDAFPLIVHIFPLNYWFYSCFETPHHWDEGVDVMQTKASRAIDVIVAGHICLDVIPEIPAQAGGLQDIFAPGKLVNVGAPVLSTGGGVANTGLSLHILGAQTMLMGKVGDDMFGRAILDILGEYEAPMLTEGMVTADEVGTSYTIVVSPPGVDRVFLHHPGANDSFCAADINKRALESARLFHFGYPPIMRNTFINGGAELVEIFRGAKATGVTTSLDMAVPDPSSEAGRVDWRDILQKTLPYVDIFLPSIDEILFMLDRNLFEDVSQGRGVLQEITPELLSLLGKELVAMGAGIVVVKLGDRGLYLCTAERMKLNTTGRAGPTSSEQLEAWGDVEMWAPCFETEVVGATGAGDATIAGFLYAFINGWGPDRALTAATAVGACNVEAADAVSGVRSWGETEMRIVDGWRRRNMTLDSTAWECDASSFIWNKRSKR